MAMADEQQAQIAYHIPHVRLPCILQLINCAIMVAWLSRWFGVRCFLCACSCAIGEYLLFS